MTQRAVVYLRRSTGRQDISLEAQRTKIEAWAEREGVEVYQWHEDCISGAAPLDKCPGLVGAIQAVKRGELLVVLNRSRWARSVERSVLQEAKLKAKGACLVAVEGGGTQDTPEGRFLGRILDAAAELELEWIRARTRAALATKRANGERTGTILYGQRLGPDGVHLLVDEQEAEAVELICRLRGAGLSLSAVAQELLERGILPRSGGRWHTAQVGRIVKANCRG